MSGDYALARRRRREVLKSLLCGAAAMSAAALTPAFARSGFVLPEGSADAQTAARFWAQPRRLRIVRMQTGESVDATFWEDGRLNADGYVRLCHLMRDLHAGQAATIDIRLLNLLFGMQGWLRAGLGIEAPYVCTSGYRTARTNAMTEGAAKNSLHMRGQAVDGRFPGFPIEYLGALQQRFAVGGTGIYLNKYRFIHADVGRVRMWRG